MADVNNIVITGTIFDNPKFYSIRESTLTVVTFSLSCNRTNKNFDPKFTFTVTATLKKPELKHIFRGTRVAVTGYISNTIDEGIEKTIIHGREILPMPVELKR